MRLLPIGAFFLRHLIAVPAIALALCLLWIVGYIILMVIAAVSGSGVGGPLALPAGLAFIALLSAGVGWGVFAPACAVGAAVCGIFRLPKVASIPFVWLAACGFGYLMYWAFIHLTAVSPMPPAPVALFRVALYLSLPAGIYWWLTEGPIALLDLAGRWWASFKKNALRLPKR